MTDTDLILARLDDVKDDLGARIVELRDRVAASNGRLGKLEADQAVIVERIQTIQARGCARASEIHAGPAGGNGGAGGSWLKPAKPLVQGGAGAGFVVFLIELAKAGWAALK